MLYKKSNMQIVLGKAVLALTKKKLEIGRFMDFKVK